MRDAYRRGCAPCVSGSRGLRALRERVQAADAARAAREELARREAADIAARRQRPYLSSECDNLPDAEKFRRDILSEVTKKVAYIQNGGFAAVSAPRARVRVRGG